MVCSKRIKGLTRLEGLQAHGIAVEWERVLEIAGAGKDEDADANTIGRPHLARALLAAYHQGRLADLIE